MTFSIVALDQPNGTLGVAVTTSVACVGALAPHVSRHAAIATQAYVNVDIGLAGMQLTDMGVPVDAALEAILRCDHAVEMRQVVGIDGDGAFFAHTGTETLPWQGHMVAEDHVVAGNSLSGKSVLEAISVRFEETRGEEFTWRLIEALAAGITAGGERETEALESSLPNSAAVAVAAARPKAFHNLRVDAAIDAVTELQRVYLEARRSSDALEAFYDGAIEIRPAYWRRVSLANLGGE